jgi:hypothetical protein
LGQHVSSWYTGRSVASLECQGRVLGMGILQDIVRRSEGPTRRSGWSQNVVATRLAAMLGPNRPRAGRDNPPKATDIVAPAQRAEALPGLARDPGRVEWGGGAAHAPLYGPTRAETRWTLVYQASLAFRGSPCARTRTRCCTPRIDAAHGSSPWRR